MSILTPRGFRRALVLSAALLLVTSMAMPQATLSSPQEEYSHPHFGYGNLPPGCIHDVSPKNPANGCYHMRVGLNALDSPEVDVLIMVPISPTAERDMRALRQVVEMWESGIHYLAPQMGLDWLERMRFHVTLDYVDMTGPNGGEFTTYPIADPEIVMIAANDAYGVGIGTDPLESRPDTCHGVANPFDLGAWEALPGFESHHEDRSGIYVEDCGGEGGNTCFSVTNASDPAPEVAQGSLRLYKNAAHEFGHCLSVGHVGDGAEGTWGPLPSFDIMSYTNVPVGGYKCVSSLDVEGVAVRMSKYLDVNGDGVVNEADHLVANDIVSLTTTVVVSGGQSVENPRGPTSGPFQVQHPRDHVYASSTGSPLHCPQPDLGLVPGPRTDWTPTPASTVASTLEVTTPQDGDTTGDGTFLVNGTVTRRSSLDQPAVTASALDRTGDAQAPFTDIRAVAATAGATELVATIDLAEMPPTTSVASPVSYSIWVNEWRIDSQRPLGTSPTAGTYPAVGTSSWDVANRRVEIRLPYSGLRSLGLRAPYYLTATANYGTAGGTVYPKDQAPDVGDALIMARPGVCEVGCSDGGVATGAVRVYVDGVEAAGQPVNTTSGPAPFEVTVSVPTGTHSIRVDWEHDGEVVASKLIGDLHACRNPAGERCVTPPS